MRRTRPNPKAYYFVLASATGIGAIIVLTVLAEQGLIGHAALMYLSTAVIAAMIVAGVGITMMLARGRSDEHEDEDAD